MLKRQKSNNESPKLYLIGTPIGNFNDMTFRAIETLKQVDLIYCEDTRITSKLLSHFDIHTPLKAYNVMTENDLTKGLVEQIKNGKNIAVVSDAGLPGISDPGYLACHDALEEDIDVVVIPGVSASLTALCASGLPTKNFYFHGFLNSKQSLRKKELLNLVDKEETLNGYYQITHQILSKYGIPYLIKTDKRTVFEYKKKASSKVEEDTFTQYAYACKELGIQIETSSVPEFKPRVERLFQTLQQRLPQELRLAKITTIDEANKFLEQFITKYNNKFALCINNNKSVFEKQPSKEKINLTLAVLCQRVVDSGHSIKYNNNYYRLINKVGRPIYFNKGTKCVVIKALDGELFATVDESIFALEKISEVQAKSENFDEIEEIKPKNIYIPRMIHPWKGKSFEEFIKTQKHRLENVA